MATARLYCAFVLLLYLQGYKAQQSLSNQNAGVNNGVGLQQQTLQQMNAQNNMNQIPNGGLNMNLPQQSNFQQPISTNLQGNTPQSFGLSPNLQVQGSSMPITNFQMTKQGFTQMPSGFAPNPSKSQSVPSSQLSNVGAKQNAQMTQIPQQQNIGPVNSAPVFQPQNMPISSNSLAEIAALKGHPSILSLFAAQSNTQPQQNQQIPSQNFNLGQNQLTDAQKQYMVRSLQSQGVPQNQQGQGCVQSQLRMAAVDNQPVMVYQGQPMSTQHPQVIMTPSSQNQPAYITVQAQPLPNYIQNQPPTNQPPVVVVDEEPSIMNLILSELQSSDPQYGAYQPYQIQKKDSKSSLKSLIPLIIQLLKDKNGYGCRNCGCPNNGCGNEMKVPSVLSGYGNQMSYNQGVEPPISANKKVEEPKKSNQNEKNNVKKNVDNVESEEVSAEDSSEYDDDSEGD